MNGVTRTWNEWFEYAKAVIGLDDDDAEDFADLRVTEQLAEGYPLA